MVLKLTLERHRYTLISQMLIEYIRIAYHARSIILHETCATCAAILKQNNCGIAFPVSILIITYFFAQ